MRGFLLVFALLVVGCQGSIDQQKAHMYGYTEKCIDGVAYLVFPAAVTVKYTPENTVVRCDNP